MATFINENGYRFPGMAVILAPSGRGEELAQPSLAIKKIDIGPRFGLV